MPSQSYRSAVLQAAAASMGIGVAVAGIVDAPPILGFSGAGIIGTLIGTWLSKNED